jgi:hypothetical protein
MTESDFLKQEYFENRKVYFLSMASGVLRAKKIMNLKQRWKDDGPTSFCDLKDSKYLIE